MPDKTRPSPHLAAKASSASTGLCVCGKNGDEQGA